MARWNLEPKMIENGGVRFEASLIGSDNKAIKLTTSGESYDVAYNAMIAKIDQWEMNKKRMDAFFEKPMLERQYVAEPPQW